ncbi:GGDEF domain-containing protein [Marinicella sp. S1101]|uniref:tetratricopeptide repeat-containing diguanylate cyclase n=1 Tax=Marinicella marina TaxID=2996016 RepID=UPI002260FE44|nr:GGDEF domain-containing protein [Marinicella marina]MCX7553874.1 GGDEF domain-containing protein [Marinicella marina]MDJ1140366.1 GGDEF domain-containing protein [Marinicella marina]
MSKLQATLIPLLSTYMVVLLLLTSQSFAQNAAVSQVIPDDYQRLDQLISNQPQTALAQLLAKDVANEPPIIKAIHFNTLSRAYISLVYPTKALESANTAMSHITAKEPQWLYHQILMVKSQAMEISGMAKEALPLVKQVVAWAKKNDEILYIDALLGLGYIENTLGNYVDALNAFMQAYNTAPETGTANTRSAIASSVALVYEYRREYDLAIPFFEESVDYHRQLKNPLELSIGLYGLGRANKNIGNVDLGTTQLDEALSISRAINDQQGVAYALKELAPLYIEKQDFEVANDMLSEAIKLFIESENKLMLFDTHKTMSVLKLKQNNINDAYEYHQKAQEYLNHERMPIQALALTELETRLMAAKGLHQQAYEKLLQIGRDRQRLLSSQSTQALHQLRTQFELQKKEQTNLLLAQENANQKLLLLKETQAKQILLISLITAAIIVLILSVTYIQNKQQKRKLYQLANFDSLTKLPNRSYTLKCLNTMSLSLHPNEQMLIVMIDLDNFKTINDVLGHDAGDCVLEKMGALCQQMIQPPQLCGRIGGEEFLLALPDTDVEKAHVIIDQLRSAYQKIDIKNNSGKLNQMMGFSAGIATHRSTDDLRESIKAADLAMYAVKHGDKNQTALANDGFECQ